MQDIPYRLRAMDDFSCCFFFLDCFISVFIYRSRNLAIIQKMPGKLVPTDTFMSACKILSIENTFGAGRDQRAKEIR